MAERARKVENLGLDRSWWAGRRVLVTGHTGFKGSWLCMWLAHLGATVSGYALDPPSSPNLYEVARVGTRLIGEHGDICRLDLLLDCMRRHQPEIVFHMAAQSLVRRSYGEPIATYMTNVIGTANVMEAVRQSGCVRVVVNITSDKVYENREMVWAYRESDPLGGHDPYSSSKACAEIVSHAYRKSFFEAEANRQVALATARAGNVIGGGDWAEDRLLPDCIRALSGGRAIQVRNSNSVRPWQHVLEPLAGYLLLAQSLWTDCSLAGAYNFGPENAGCKPVSWIADAVTHLWGDGVWKSAPEEPSPHEASLLSLDSTLARVRLGWVPRLALTEALRLAIEWYRAYYQGADMAALTLQQVVDYSNAVLSGGAATSVTV